MNFNHVPERTDLRNFVESLMGEDCDLGQAADKPYRERFKEAGKKIEDFCARTFEGETERAEAMEYLFQQIGVHERISFEMGLLVGVKLAKEAQSEAATATL